MLDAGVSRLRLPTTLEEILAVFASPSPPPAIIFESPPALPEPLPSPSTSAGSTPLRPPLESDASYASNASCASDDTSNPALDDTEELIYVDEDIFMVAAQPLRTPHSATTNAYPIFFWIGHRLRHGARSTPPLTRL